MNGFPTRFYTSSVAHADWFHIGPIPIRGYRWHVWEVDTGGSDTYTKLMDSGWCPFEPGAQHKAAKALDALQANAQR